MTTTDDLPAEHLEMIAVSLKRFLGKAVLQQVHHERVHDVENALSDGDILMFDMPQPWPIFPVRTKRIERQAGHWNNGRILFIPRFEYHALGSLTQCVASLSWVCL